MMIFPERQPASQTEMLSRIHPPPLVRRVLPNGLTLLVQEDRSRPLVAFHAVVPTGSATEGQWLGAGVSHVLEHMLFKGTERRPVGAVEQEARSYGGTTQGFTSYDTTSYQAVVNREHWSEAADLLVDALFFPSLDPEEFRKEREVVLRELKLRADDPSQTAWDLLFSSAYRAHPYRLPIIGYEPLLNRLTAEDVKAYHKLHYHPDQMVIAVVGDVETQAVVRRFEGLMEKIPRGRVTLAVLPEEPPPVGPQTLEEISPNSRLGLGAIGFPSVSVDHPDLFALDLLAWLLGGGRGSRLEQSLKEPGVVHTVQAWDYAPKHRGLFVVTLRCDPDRLDEAVKGVFDEVEKAKETPFQTDEIQAAKRTMLRGYLQDRQTVGAEASDLATYEVLVRDPAFAYRYLEGVERVTVEDLRRVARLYLRFESATTVKLFPEGTPMPETLATSRMLAGGEVVRREVLDNGLTVLLKSDPRLPLAAVQVSMLGGVRMETERIHGISLLTSRMLLSGTRSRSAKEITDRIRQMGGELAPFSGRNSLGLSLEVMRSQLPEGLDLLSDLVLNPVFPTEELEKEKRLALAGLKVQEEDPFAWGMRRLMGTLFTVHPYRLDPAGSAESLEELTREQLRTFYAQIRDPRQMVISVVGDLDEAEVLKQLAETWGSWSLEGQPLPLAQKEPQMQHRREHVEGTAREEALVMIGFQGLTVSDSRAPVLDLIETVLSGGAGRLFNEVRERQGLAYTVGAFTLHGVDPGAFVLYAVTEPPHLEAVRQALMQEILRLHSEPVPEEEFRRAKQGLLGARRIAHQSYGAKAAQMGLDELYGLGYDYPKRYEAQVLDVSAQDVQSLARVLLDPERAAVVVGRPESSGALHPEADRFHPAEGTPVHPGSS